MTLHLQDSTTPSWVEKMYFLHEDGMDTGKMQYLQMKKHFLLGKMIVFNQKSRAFISFFEQYN